MGLFGKTTKDGSLDRRYKSNSGGYLGKGIRFVSDVSSIISIYNKREEPEEMTEQEKRFSDFINAKRIPLLIVFCVLIIGILAFNPDLLKRETQILENPDTYEEVVDDEMSVEEEETIEGTYEGEEEIYEEVQYNDNPYNDNPYKDK